MIDVTAVVDPAGLSPNVVRVVDDPHTATGPGLQCLVCEDGIDAGLAYVFACSDAGNGVIGECCWEQTVDARSGGTR